MNMQIIFNIIDILIGLGFFSAMEVRCALQKLISFYHSKLSKNRHLHELIELISSFIIMSL